MTSKRLLVTVLATLSIAAGACTSSPTGGLADAQGSSSRCESFVSWEDASQHVGERSSVQGPVVSTNYAVTSNGEPTFLNVGREYPDEGRFTVVIWGEDRANFSAPPEDLYDGATICVTGMIETYEGVPEIVLRSEADILVES